MGRTDYFVTFYLACGLSITAGYHRLFSHRTHKAAWPMRLFYALFGAAAFKIQRLSGAAITADIILKRMKKKILTRSKKDSCGPTWDGSWSTKGKRLSNMLRTSRKIESLLGKTAIFSLSVSWLELFYQASLVSLQLVEPKGFLGGMIYGGFLRVVVVHHATFLINSAAHTWGTQPYSTANTSRDSPILSFFTFGEGYHNFHHTFQADYRNGHKWYHWDPSKWWIKVASWFGLTKDLHTIPKKSIESQRMKTAFETNSDETKVSHELQDKLTQCVQQLRKSFSRTHEAKGGVQGRKTGTKKDSKAT